MGPALMLGLLVVGALLIMLRYLVGRHQLPMVLGALPPRRPVHGHEVALAGCPRAEQRLTSL